MCVFLSAYALIQLCDHSLLYNPPKKHRIHIHNNITNAWIECFKFPGSGLLHTEKAVTTDYKVTPFEK